MFTTTRPWLPLLAALGLMLWLLVWPPVSDQFIGAAGTLRLLVLIVTLGPVAVLLGMPFPIGLHALRHDANYHVSLAWAVNGVMIVLGSVASVAISIVSGFQAVLILSILVYALTFIVARFTIANAD